MTESVKIKKKNIYGKKKYSLELKDTITYFTQGKWQNSTSKIFTPCFIPV